MILPDKRHPVWLNAKSGDERYESRVAKLAHLALYFLLICRVKSDVGDKCDAKGKRSCGTAEAPPRPRGRLHPTHACWEINKKGLDGDCDEYHPRKRVLAGDTSALTAPGCGASRYLWLISPLCQENYLEKCVCESSVYLISKGRFVQTLMIYCTSFKNYFNIACLTDTNCMPTIINYFIFSTKTCLGRTWTCFISRKPLF